MVIIPPIFPFTPDYAGIAVEGNSTPTQIPLVNSYTLCTAFADNMPNRISIPDASNNKMTAGLSADYFIALTASMSITTGTNKVFEFEIFSLSPAITITSLATSNPVIITAADHGLSDGDHVAVKGVGGTIELNNRIFIAQDVSGATFELVDEGGTSPGNDIDGTGFTSYTSGGVIHPAAKTNCHSHRKFANTDIGSLAGSAIWTEHTRHTIELYIIALTDTTNILVEHASLSFHRIGY